MRHVGHEVATHDLETAELRHVVEDEDEAEGPAVGTTQRCRIHVERPSGGQGQIPRGEGGAARQLARQLGDLGIPDELDEAPPAALERARQLEEVARPLVHEHDPSAEIRDDDPFHHAAKNRLESLVLDPQLRDRGRHVARHHPELCLEHAEVVAALGDEIRRRLPSGEPPREADQTAYPPQHPSRQDERGREAEPDRREHAGHEQAAQVRDVGGDRGEGQRDADDPHVVAACLPPGCVEHPRADRRAPALPLARSGLERVVDLGSVGVVFEFGRRAGGFAQHPPVGGDYRDAGPEVRPQPGTRGIERLAAGPGQRLAGEPRLGEQALRQRLDLMALDGPRKIRNGGQQRAEQRDQRRRQELEGEPTVPARPG